MLDREYDRYGQQTLLFPFLLPGKYAISLELKRPLADTNKFHAISILIYTPYNSHLMIDPSFDAVYKNLPDSVMTTLVTAN